MWAAFNGQISMLKLLIDSGGDVNVRDNVSDMLVMLLSVSSPPVQMFCFLFIQSLRIWFLSFIDKVSIKMFCYELILYNCISCISEEEDFLYL